jgi:hypothetical protein
MIKSDNMDNKDYSGEEKKDPKPTGTVEKPDNMGEKPEPPKGVDDDKFYNKDKEQDADQNTKPKKEGDVASDNKEDDQSEVKKDN